jgi:hypothetical protein
MRVGRVAMLLIAGMVASAATTHFLNETRQESSSEGSLTPLSQGLTAEADRPRRSPMEASGVGDPGLARAPRLEGVRRNHGLGGASESESARSAERSGHAVELSPHDGGRAIASSRGDLDQRMSFMLDLLGASPKMSDSEIASALDTAWAGLRRCDQRQILDAVGDRLPIREPFAALLCSLVSPHDAGWTPASRDSAATDRRSVSDECELSLAIQAAGMLYRWRRGPDGALARIIDRCLVSQRGDVLDEALREALACKLSVLRPTEVLVPICRSEELTSPAGVFERPIERKYVALLVASLCSTDERVRVLSECCEAVRATGGPSEIGSLFDARVHTSSETDLHTLLAQDSLSVRWISLKVLSDRSSGSPKLKFAMLESALGNRQLREMLEPLCEKLSLVDVEAMRARVGSSRVASVLGMWWNFLATDVRTDLLAR